MKRKQMGFTIVELLAVVWVCVCLAIAGGAGYIVVHFISKFW
jgi:type II secretory pathway pseudopilin PulG